MLFAELMKEASRQVKDFQSDTAILQGYVEKFKINEPKKEIFIRVSQKLILGIESLVFSETAYNSIGEKDNVILIKQLGGQKYYVIDKVAMINDTNKQ